MDRPIHEPCQSLANRQTEAGATICSGSGKVCLGELSKKVINLVWSNADSCIGNANTNSPRLFIPNPL